MRKGFILIALALAATAWLPGNAAADEPIKWSAPLSAYPNQWAPSAHVPAYNNQYATQYPYWNGYGGYQPHGGTAPSWQPAYAPGVSGNPYFRPYAP